VLPEWRVPLLATREPSSTPPVVPGAAPALAKAGVGGLSNYQPFINRDEYFSPEATSVDRRLSSCFDDTAQRLESFAARCAGKAGPSSAEVAAYQKRRYG